MPIVPTYDDSQSLSGMPPTPKMNSAAGAGVERASRQLHDELTKQATQMSETYDRTRALEAYNEFEEQARQKYNEFKMLEGREAIGAVDKYRQWYEKEPGKLVAKLDNPRQQQAFREKAWNRRERDLDALSSHEAAQFQKYRVTVHQGTVAQAQANVMLHFGDDNRMADIEQRIDESYESTFPGIDTSADKQKDIAALRALRIQLLAEDHPEKAESLLEKQKDSIAPVYLKLKEHVAKAGVKKESQLLTDEIVATEGDFQKQLELARGIENPEVRDATVTRVKARQEERKQILKDQEDERMDRLTSEIMDLYRGGAGREDALDLIDDEASRKAITPLVNALFGEKQQTDFSQLTIAMEEIDKAVESGKPLTENYLLRTYKPALKDSDWKTLANYNRRAAEARTGTAVTSAKTRISQMYNRGDFGKTGANRGAIKTKASLLMELDEWTQANPKKDPTEWLNLRIEQELSKDAQGWLGRWWESFTGIDTDGNQVIGGDNERVRAARILRDAGKRVDEKAVDEFVTRNRGKF